METMTQVEQQPPPPNTLVATGYSDDDEREGLRWSFAEYMDGLLTYICYTGVNIDL